MNLIKKAEEPTTLTMKFAIPVVVLLAWFLGDREHLIRVSGGVLRVLTWLVFCAAHGEILFAAMTLSRHG